jgi:hypothetical protein
MIFNLKTIAGKDWYGWGARRIVDIQKEEGCWHEYHGPIPDTCFALLFLKRVNVARDLTQQLQLLGPIRDPGSVPGKPSPGVLGWGQSQLFLPTYRVSSSRTISSRNWPAYLPLATR